MYFKFVKCIREKVMIKIETITYKYIIKSNCQSNIKIFTIIYFDMTIPKIVENIMVDVNKTINSKIEEISIFVFWMPIILKTKF